MAPMNLGVEGMAERELADVVLSWSLEEILDDNLFADKVERIPRTFQSVRDYFQSYVAPLLEETRADLSSSLELIKYAPSFKIQCIERAKNPGFFFFVDVDCSSNDSCGSSDGYKARNGDLYILSSIRPETADDLMRYGVTFCMVLVTESAIYKMNIDSEDDVFERGFKVEASKNIDTENDSFVRGFEVKASKNIGAEDDATNYQIATFLANIMTNARIWRAIHFGEVMDHNFNVINAVLHPKRFVGLNCNICSSSERDCWFSKLPDEIVSIGLNESQIQAVKSAVSTLSCMHSHSVKLIWGPPGTGKTKTVCSMLFAFLHMKCRVLTCAPTNIAVVGICSRLLCLVKNLQDSNSLIDLPFLLGDVVLFGNKDRMKINDELLDVFLEHRVEQLVDCLSPIFGWKHRVSAMINFVENCGSQYESYVENRSGGDGGDGGTSFLDFVRKQFDAAASPLETCLQNLCIHLPRSNLSKKDTERIQDVLNLLETLRNLIFKEDAIAEGLQEIFLNDDSTAECPLVQDDFNAYKLGLSARKQLEEAKAECLSILKVLERTLKLPYGVGKNWIQKFCLSNASLIFCTASSSSFLHYVEMNPIDILIVDEAAQLKECETAIPLRINGINHAILVGDECQLQSLVKSQACKAAGFGLSLFERLASLGHPKHLLNVQYRMHPSISSFPNAKFYGKQILDGPNVKAPVYGKNYSDLLFGHYAFVNITDGREEADDIGSSRKNMVEVAVVLQLIRSIFKSWQGNSESLSIGVVASYSSQVKEISEKLCNTYHKTKGFDVRVNSIDGFQGEEDDIIILSTVRCNGQGSIGFLSDFQRMNVSLTRARHCCWILGNSATLSQSGSLWEDLVHDARSRQCFFNANDNKSLEKLIRNVKWQLDQFNDLFNPDSALSTSMWKVLFSIDFTKSIAKLKSLQTRREVVQMLLRLANGWRSKKNTVATSDSFGLTKIYRVREHYLVWSIDISKDERYIQVIKVWNILPFSQLSRFTNHLDNLFSMYTGSYLNHCKANLTEGNIEVPVSWNGSHVISQFKKHCDLELEDAELEQIDGDVLENSKVSESLLLMKFYALTSGIASHLLTANDGTELNIPFELTDEEKQVVRFPSSSFILGRSGTGKTTILTTKLVQKEQQYRLSIHGLLGSKDDHSKAALENDLELKKGNLLRQVFITVSPKLCLAIQDHISRLTSFTANDYLYAPPSAITMHDNSDQLAEFMNIPDTFRDLPHKHYPLVITFRKFLTMLDGTMPNSFLDKFSNGSGVSKSLAFQIFTRNEVNYDKFVDSYWPHFNTQMTKKLDASIVYTEIISHIKGGLEAGSLNGRLGRSDYVMLAEKRVSAFCQETRDDIYDIFLDYEKRKSLNGEFDISDFVIDLHEKLRYDVYPGDKFDFVYVDEVQDLTMRQIALLKHVCPNYEEGFIFAGDTAQTIAKGVDFRFEDIRCLFYKEFLSELRIEDRERKKERLGLKDNFQLNRNFRTHSGVLKLAKSIMDLLYNFFPLNIDRIAPEVSLIYGESPVLLESNNDENAIVTIFGGTTGERSNMIEFGADQAILVRDNCAKKQIVDIVGNKALVLTIIECKGLEFQDVLLYNFFGGSLLKNKWRVVYEYMDKKGFCGRSAIASYPNFNHSRHHLLCSELKQLYVAVTRTRQRLWICENSNDFCKPIFDYWKSLCLVQVRHLDSSLAQAMRTVSTPEEWRLRGIKLFNEENFEMATMCFERAGDAYREKWARAAGLVSTADRVISSKPEEAEAVLKKAAVIYESIGKPESAATCFIKFKDFNSAGKLYMEKCGDSRLELAGDCFAMVEHWSLAADLYAKAKCFSKCLSMCSKGELFDSGLHFIKHWKEDSHFNKLELHGQDVEKSFVENCVMHYIKLRDVKHMAELARILKSMGLIRTFLKSRNYLDELLDLETLMGNYLEAADIAHLKGDILLEADMLQKARHFNKSAELILLHIIVSSLWAPGSKGWPLKKFAQKEALLCKALGMAKQTSDSFHDQVSSEVYVLSDRPKNLLNLSKHLVEARKYQNIRLEIFTLREIIDFHLGIDPCKYIWEPGMVSDVENHTNLVMSQNICSVESLMHIWRLWKEHILSVLSYLNLSIMTKGNDFESYERFCFEYLGVSTGSDQNSFVLLNPEAAWINSCKTAQKGKNLSMMDIKQFKASAQRYWRLELLSVTVAIIEKFESLISFSKCCARICSSYEVSAEIGHCKSLEKNAPFPFSKGRVILAMHEAVKYYRESEIISLESIDKITRIYTSSCEYFFSILFPVKWEEGSNISMLDFHQSINAKEIIEESVDGYLSLFKGKLTFGQVGRMVMLLFLTGDLNDKFYNKIIPQLHQMPPWKDLIIALREFSNCNSHGISLMLKLEKAMGYAFRTDWSGKNDYMSPHCFMYLVDCLLFCASSCLGSGGVFFSTKATLFEILRCHGLKGYREPRLVAPNDLGAFNAAHYCLNSIIEMIRSLLMNKTEIKEWVLKSSLDRFDYGYLITKMVITLYLAFLNSGNTFYLWEFLTHNNILVDLHEGFRDAIVGCIVHRKNISVLANALRMNQDSLVIVVSKDEFDFSKFNAIVVSSEELRSRGDVIAKLFLKTSCNEWKVQSEQELAGSNFSGNVHRMCEIEEEKNQPLDIATRIGDDDPQETHRQMCIDLKTWLERCNEIKLDYIIHCLDTLIEWFSKDVRQREEDILLEMRKMLLEIKFHSSLIDGGIKLPCTTAEELDRRCPGWKSNLISFTDSLIKEMNYSAADLIKETNRSAESIPEINGGCCEESREIAENPIGEEDEGIAGSPRGQNMNKGNGKKPRQKCKRKGKAKGKKAESPIAKETEGIADSPPRNQNMNKGSGKKPKQIYKRKEKGKKR